MDGAKQQRLICTKYLPGVRQQELRWNRHHGPTGKYLYVKNALYQMVVKDIEP